MEAKKRKPHPSAGASRGLKPRRCILSEAFNADPVVGHPLRVAPLSAGASSPRPVPAQPSQGLHRESSQRKQGSSSRSERQLRAAPTPGWKEAAWKLGGLSPASPKDPPAWRQPGLGLNWALPALPTLVRGPPAVLTQPPLPARLENQPSSTGADPTAPGKREPLSSFHPTPEAASEEPKAGEPAAWAPSQAVAWGSELTFPHTPRQTPWSSSTLFPQPPSPCTVSWHVLASHRRSPPAPPRLSDLPPGMQDLW